MENAGRTFVHLTLASVVFILVMYLSLEVEYGRQTPKYSKMVQTGKRDSENEDEGDWKEKKENYKQSDKEDWNEETEEMDSKEENKDDNDNDTNNFHGDHNQRKARVSSVCRDVFEIQKLSPNMTEWMTNAVKVIRSRKRRKQFIPSLFYEAMGVDSPAMTAKVNDSSGVMGSNLTIAKVGRGSKRECGIEV